MRGQWIGKYSGSIQGCIIVNIDEMPDNYVGIAYVKPTDQNFPASAAYFVTADKSLKQNIEAYVNPLDPKTGFQ